MVSEVVIVGTLILAGLIRGYTGFGFSGLVIVALSIFYPVADLVPAILLVDLFISLPLVATCWKQADFTILTPLLWATMLGIPFGLGLLYALSDELLKVLVPSTILTLAFLSRHPSLVIQKLSQSKLLCGFTSGWTTSAVSSGGTPVVMYMRQQALSNTVKRASLICYFFLVNCLAVGGNYTITKQWAMLPSNPVIYVLIAFLSALAGRRLFIYKDFESIHEVAFYLLLTVSSGTLIIAVWSLFS
ncbi:sulfite exporter TauE/SafE family protein [Vibrio campbellii]|jgi:uncharacterized membrane protein YfcA